MTEPNGLENQDMSEADKVTYWLSLGGIFLGSIVLVIFIIGSIMVTIK